MAKAKDDTKEPEQAPDTEPETAPQDTQPDAPEEQETEPAVLVFVGDFLPDGRPALFLPGVPARDLTPSDLDQLDENQQKAALKSGLYRDAKEAS